jgi:cytoskeletal protein RodZ
MIRHAVRTALVASLIAVAACGPAPRESAPSSSAGASSTTPSTTHTPTTTTPATTVADTTTTITSNLPTTTIKNQSASNTPRTTTTTTTTTTVAELPGGIQVSPTMNQVLILSTGPGRLLLGSITEISGSGLVVDTSDCGTTMPSGNVCVVRFNASGVPSGTIFARLRVESNSPASPDIVNVTVVVP